MNKVYIVYQGNLLLLNLIIKGIYTDLDDAIEDILDNHRFRPEEIIFFDEDNEDDALLTTSQRKEIADMEIRRCLEEDEQIIGFRTSYIIKPIKLNKWQ